jgi:hypothetical protein
MSGGGKDIQEHAGAWHWQRRRLRLECRECEIICERVVSPWHCLRSNCRYVYSLTDEMGEYFGCLHKIFGPELDLAAFRRPDRPGDPYGALKAASLPRPDCRCSV